LHAADQLNILPNPRATNRSHTYTLATLKVTLMCPT